MTHSTRSSNDRPTELTSRAAIAFFLALVLSQGISRAADDAGTLMAGAAKVDITSDEAGPANDRLYAKALVLQNGADKAVLITVDAVAIGEIGPIKNNYLGNVRAGIEKELQIKPTSVLINASHCHGIVCGDVDARTVQAVKQAAKNLVPVKVGSGRGQENRIMENRRLKLKNGRVVDVRHAYSMPLDEEVAEVGPVDPEIGILRLDRVDDGPHNGQTVAVIYNFACHPIQGVPSGKNTADLTGFASQVIEDNLSEGAVALFVQGCGGDINPVMYKDVEHPRNAEPLGQMLGLSTLRGLKKIQCKADGRLKVINEKLALPRADAAERIAAMEAEQQRLLLSLRGTSLNLKTFLPLVVKYNLATEFPSYYSHRYLHDEKLGRNDFRQMDADNRRNMKQYIDNITTMEELTRLQTNLVLLRKHQADNVASGERTINVEVVGLRIGDFTLITFPGELTVRIGLNIKQKSTHPNTFVAGYTNGYIYYAPTSEQLLNPGAAQEDSDCILAPEWQALFEAKAAELLGRL